MHEVPHAPGYTLAADGFMEPHELVGFSTERHFLTVFSHAHDFYEFALVLSGSGVHTAAGESRRVGRGCVVFVAPGLNHGWELCDNMTVYNCFIRAEASQFELWWAHRDVVLGGLFAPGGMPPRAPTIVNLSEVEFATCHRHLEAVRLRPRDERRRVSDIGNLLLALDVVGRNLAEDVRPDALVDSDTPAVIARAVALLEQDLRQRWTLEMLEEELALGRFHLVRLFRRWVGQPPIAYANRRRAERAAISLVRTDLPIGAIGAEVGWPDPSGFARSFRRYFGVTPRVYRRQSRAQGRRAGSVLHEHRTDGLISP
jgi:AraC-like DNA-binding protein